MKLTDLAAVYSAPGPFVSLYLDTASQREDAATQWELRWKNVLRDLADEGVDEETTDALTAARGEHGLGGTRVLVAGQGSVLLATSLDEPPGQDIIRVDVLPHLLPLVDRLSLRLPHLVVLADREGADILAYTGEAAPVETESVDGSGYPIHKVPSGGWSQRRFQARVEESWEHNAKEVADRIDAVARDVGPALLVMTGDTRALSLIRDNLPDRLTPLWQEVPGGRGRDGGDSHVAGHVLQALGERITKDTIDLLGQYAEERGQRNRAADGVPATVTALRQAQVETLLLTAEFDPDRRGWFGDAPTMLGLDRQELLDLGEQHPREAALVDVLLRAAIGTDADVRVVPGGTEHSPTDGVGALLRYSLG